jgi:hypothetical protein
MLGIAHVRSMISVAGGLLTGRPTSQKVPGMSGHPYRDLAFVAAIIALASLPLIVLRYQPIVSSTAFICVIWCVGGILFAAWVRSKPSFEEAPWESLVPGRVDLARAAIIVASCLTVTVVAYYLPLRMHFWGGYDEIYCLDAATRSIWTPIWESMFSRPLWGIGPFLGSIFAVDRLDGFLWVASGLCMVNGLLLAGIIRRLLPGNDAVAIGAAILLICHHGDIARFLVMWASIWYWSALALMLMGTWLFIESARLGNRWGLVASCSFLGASLLSSEAGFPLAVLGPLLIWLAGARGGRFQLWSAAWFATTGMLAIRFIEHFLFQETHAQRSDLTEDVSRNPALLLVHLQTQFMPFFKWFVGFESVRPRLASTGLVAASAALALLLAGAASSQRTRPFLIAIVVCLAAAAAGLLPFFFFPGAPFRTQLYTAPGQAAFIAVALATICRTCGSRMGLVVFTGAISVLAGIAAADNRKFQLETDKYINYTKTVHIIRQIHAAGPTLPPDCLIVLLPDDDSPSCLGSSRTFATAAHIALDRLVIPAYSGTPLDFGLEFDADRVRITSIPARTRIPAIAPEYPMEKVILFRLSTDGTVRLLTRVPETLVPDPAVDARYHPLSLLGTGPLRELRYFRYPSWVARPQDVIDTENGFVMGAGWFELEQQGSNIFRYLAQGGELVINSQGRSTRTVTLDIEPVARGKSGLEVRNAQGDVLLRTEVDGRQRIEFSVPTHESHASIVTLWSMSTEPSSAAKVAWRVHVPAGSHHTRPLEKRDVADASITIGKDWYPRETFQGLTFRWLGNSAEIIIKRDGADEVLMDVAAGPTCGEAARLRAIGTKGELLCERKIPTRGVVRLTLPPNLPLGSAIRLEVAGGRTAGPITAGADTRTLNLQVFSCRRPLTADLPTDASDQK